MGAIASSRAEKTPSAEKFKFTTTRQHKADIARVVKTGVVAKMSEAIRRAWYEAKAANTPMFRDAGGK